MSRKTAHLTYDQLVPIIRANHWTLKQAGAYYGVSRERIRQLLARQGLTIGALRDVRCSYCGAPITAARGTTRYGRHVCQRLRCRMAHTSFVDTQRHTPLPPRVCTVCGGPMRPLGRQARLKYPDMPDICTRHKACLSAKMRWKMHNDPDFRARQYASIYASNARRGNIDQKRYRARQRMARAMARQATTQQEVA